MALDSWFDFTGRVALVTGGAGGIGVELVAAFVAQGATTIVADIDSAAADDVANRVGAVAGYQLDVSDSDSVDRLVSTVWDNHGAIDVAVNPAAVYVRRAALELDEADYDRTMDVNVKGTWLLCSSVGRRMVERGFGRIVNYTSNAGLRGSPLQVAYNASKAAVISMTKTLAVEWARTGVTVNAVAPGPTDTPLMTPAFAEPGAREAFAQRIPQGGLTPPDVTVGPVLFLASPMAAAITGHTLFADGGMSAT